MIPRKFLPEKSKINLSLTTCLEYNLMTLSCMNFTVSLSWNIWLQEKLCWITTIFFIFSPLTIKKIASNTKINHVMVSSTNHYNAISIDRVSSKSKIEKYSWYINNSLLCNSGVSSATKTFLFLLKTEKYNCSGLLAFKSRTCTLRFC